VLLMCDLKDGPSRGDKRILIRNRDLRRCDLSPRNTTCIACRLEDRPIDRQNMTNAARRIRDMSRRLIYGTSPQCCEVLGIKGQQLTTRPVNCNRLERQVLADANCISIADSPRSQMGLLHDALAMNVAYS